MLTVEKFLYYAYSKGPFCYFPESHKMTRDFYPCDAAHNAVAVLVV